MRTFVLTTLATLMLAGAAQASASNIITKEEKAYCVTAFKMQLVVQGGILSHQPVFYKKCSDKPIIAVKDGGVNTEVK